MHIISIFFCCSCTLCFLALVHAGGNSRLQEKQEEDQEPESFLSAWRHKARYGLDYEGNRISHVALYHTHPGSFYGTQAKIGIWGSPNQGHLQESGTFILLTSNELLDFSAIEVGFHVYLKLYNDSHVHFFVHWTKDNYKSTGCFNLKCEGFVLASAALVPGQVVAPESSYDIEQQYIPIGLSMSPSSGDWTLYRTDYHPEVLGYFPGNLVPALAHGSPRLAWAGFTSYPYNEPGPPMGSGHLPGKSKGRGSTIEGLKIIDMAGYHIAPIPGDLIPVVDRADCYGLGDVMNAELGFSYGGPAGCKG